MDKNMTAGDISLRIMMESEKYNKSVDWRKGMNWYDFYTGDTYMDLFRQLAMAPENEGWLNIENNARRAVRNISGDLRDEDDVDAVFIEALIRSAEKQMEILTEVGNRKAAKGWEWDIMVARTMLELARAA